MATKRRVKLSENITQLDLIQSLTKKMKKSSQVKPSSPKKVVGESESKSESKFKNKVVLKGSMKKVVGEGESESKFKNKVVLKDSNKKVLRESDPEWVSLLKELKEPCKVTPEVSEYYRKYGKIVDESEGFTSIPHERKIGLAYAICGGITPVTAESWCSESVARFAVDEQNKKGENIILEGIVKVNVQLQDRIVHYMTLKTLVRDGAHAQTVFYEAKVYCTRSTHHMEVEIFRKAIHYKPEDCLEHYKYHECRHLRSKNYEKQY